MDYQSAPSLPAETEYPPTQGAFPVWIRVFTQPGEKTFLEITAHPEAKAKSAYIWVFIVGTLAGLISSLSQFAATLIGLRQVAPEIGQMPGFSGMLGAAGLVGALCSAPLTGLFSVMGFALGVAIIHATARFFGGQGSFDRLAYAFGAIVAPFSLLSGLAAPFNLIPYVALCTLPVLLLVSLYVLYLEVVAIKAVHQCGWGEAMAILFLPTILIALLCGVLAVGLLSVAGPSINEFFQQYQQMQPGVQ